MFIYSLRKKKKEKVKHRRSEEARWSGIQGESGAQCLPLNPVTQREVKHQPLTMGEEVINQVG